MRRVLYSLVIAVSMPLSCKSIDDEPQSFNESEPDTIVMSVVDTLGLLYGDSTLVFGSITQASWGRDGSLYVLDGQQGRLAVYSRELELIRYVGRLGSGPGEFQYPQSFAFLGDGRFAVCDWGARSVLFFSSDMEYLNQHTGYYPSSPRFIVSGPGSSYVAMGMELDEDASNIDGNSFVARYGQDKEPEQVLDSWPLMITVFGDPGDADADVSIGRVDHDFDSDLNGAVYLAEKDDSTYLVEVFLPDGNSSVLVEKDWEQMAKSREELEREVYEETMTQEGSSRIGRRAFQDVYPWHYAIESVDVDLHGDIWIGQGYTSMPTFEVYSPSGELQFVAVIPDLEGVDGLEFNFRNGYLAYDRQPTDYPKVYFLEP